MKKIFNYGIYEKGKYVTKSKEYRLWYDMLRRAFVIYDDVEVCERWLDFQTFASDINEVPFMNEVDENSKPYNLDKDILGLELYSNETVCFVPQKINKFFINARKIYKNDLPTGVYPSKEKFKSLLSINSELIYLGSYDTIEETYQVYCKARNEYARELAKEYKNKVDERVIKILEDYDEEVWV